MANIFDEQKKVMTKKFLEFQKAGLEKYAKYLEQQLKISGKSELQAPYKRYVEKEIIRNDKLLATVNSKIEKL